jgi:hypothetical protein
LVRIGNYINKKTEEDIFPDLNDDKTAMTIAILLFAFFAIITSIVDFFAS